jgi:caa(3)-type oxidase subunit IV
MKEIVYRHLRVAGALVLLLVATTAFAFVPAGVCNWIVALIISFTMTGLMMLFFMQLRKCRPLIWLTSGVGFFWLSILLVLMLMDYLSRPWPG